MLERHLRPSGPYRERIPRRLLRPGQEPERIFPEYRCSNCHKPLGTPDVDLCPDCEWLDSIDE
jgi:hypothetical protein